MKPFQQILNTILLFGFASACNTNNSTSINSTSINSTSNNSIALDRPFSINPLIGEWHYQSTIWYTANLSILDDGAFKYHTQSCLGHTYSEGKWQNINGIVVLTSNDSFKPKEIVETQPSKADNVKTSKVTFVLPEYVKNSTLSGPNDTVGVYLSKEQVVLKGDSLYGIFTNKILKETTFHKASRLL